MGLTVDTAFMEGKIVDVEFLSDRVRQITIDYGKEPFSFKPGQFVAVNPVEGQLNPNLWTYYSIASAPVADHIFDLCVSIENSSSTLGFDPLSTFVVGKRLKLKQAAGVFTLPDAFDGDLVFIGTGTGIAPIRSMVHNLINNHQMNRSIHIIFGARTYSEILYKDEFDQISSRYPNFKYDIVLSRDDGWQGYRGYVDEAYMDLFQQPRQDTLIYLCGWPDMVRKAINDFIYTLGFKQNQLVYELYG